ncbi:MAG: archaellin/type IV pilin N-terminal domain-containing protein [Methanomassiliicoccus sp.]|nr:archaellin/type IV pilin N-terminal domain-containing protein [Methanomassiliicoccus sp.]
MKVNNRGEMGVGTMIIFIAAVLVSAVSASVLISTANVVREQATETGNEAITSASTGFVLDYIYGDVSHNRVTDLCVYLKLAPGSASMDVTGTVVSVTISAGGESMSADLVLDQTNTVILNDRVEFIISGLSIPPSSSISIDLIPAHGFTCFVTFTTPDVMTEGIMYFR